MTDLTATSVLPRRANFDSDEMVARVKRRYRSEWRFKALGGAALVLTAVFVIAVLSDIVIKGTPAFTQHSLMLDVPVRADVVDPKGTRNPEDLRSADYFALMREALATAIPGIEGRAEKKRLSGLLSSGAGNELRDRVLADPTIIGTTVKVPLLLSDDSDIYLKGKQTRVLTVPSRGTATPSGTTGEITVLTSANDFADDLVTVKKALAARIEDEKSRLAIAEGRGESQASEVANLKDEIAALSARAHQPGVEEVLDGKMPSLMVAINGGLVKLNRISASSATGTVYIPLKSADEAAPGAWSVVTYERPESNRKTTDIEAAFLEKLRADGKVENRFNTIFFTHGDSRDAELAGILGSLVGSILMLIVTLSLALPFGVLAAVYLEEFAPKNKLTNLIEININNLAAVPSIVFGLLGLAVFLNFFGLPRSAPLVGGLVLALLVLPTIIIAARASMKAVPPSIKEAALGVGASHQQAIFHHVLPLATPGIMTGTIIGMAHALGETAPLLMIGMLAFIVDVPQGFLDPATALPAQIYIWSDLPEQAFEAKTAAAIMILLGVLLLMNGLAIWLRSKFERRW
ncbi:MAG TPA: phosphate ABC transporter permease PstA [Hyphomicrobium sp.]|nr:phosphate ABC transporter permease PstA [Hyphomicrobium sp.]